MASKKLTVKKVIAIVVLTVLACLGLFGVMFITLILTQSATAVVIAEFIYAAMVMLLCTVPGRKKGYRFKAGVSLLLLATLGCFVALAWSYASYLGYRDRILMSPEPIVRPFLSYGHTFNLLWVIGALTCVWIWVGYNYRKARSKIVVLSLLFIIGLTAFATPMVKAESCDVDVVGWLGSNLTPRTFAQDLRARAFHKFKLPDSITKR